MIIKAELNELSICAKIIRQSFLPVAKTYNITKENSPNYVAFSINSNKLKKQFDNGREMYVYKIDNKIVGFFALEFLNNECEINNLCVLPEYQNQGIGNELLEYAILLARQKKSSKIKLSIVEENSKLKEWYRKFGFVHTHIIKYDFFSFTCGYMERKL